MQNENSTFKRHFLFIINETIEPQEKSLRQEEKEDELNSNTVTTKKAGSIISLDEMNVNHVEYENSILDDINVVEANRRSVDQLNQQDALVDESSQANDNDNHNEMNFSCYNYDEYNYIENSECKIVNDDDADVDHIKTTTVTTSRILVDTSTDEIIILNDEKQTNEVDDCAIAELDNLPSTANNNTNINNHMNEVLVTQNDFTGWLNFCFFLIRHIELEKLN